MAAERLIVPVFYESPNGVTVDVEFPDGQEISLSVDEAERLREYLNRELSRELTEPERRCFEIVDERGELKARELYDEYQRRIEGEVSERTIRDYLTTLQRRGYVEQLGESSATRYAVTGVQPEGA